MIRRKEGLTLIIFLAISFALAITGNVVQESTVSSVSISGLRILAESFDGTTTDFSLLGTEELNNLSEMTLEKSFYGKIIFDTPVNLSLTAGEDRLVNFDANLNISSNLISIDSDNLPYLNKSVRIYLYDLSFLSPRIMKGSSICSDCNIISYSGGNLIFNSSIFSDAYYVIETPVSPVCGNGICESGENSNNCPSDCGSVNPSGGEISGGVETPLSNVTPTGYDFYVVPDIYVIKMSKGQYTRRDVTIVNNGTYDLDFYIALENVKDFVFPQENSFHVSAGKNYTLRLNFYYSQFILADVYIGKVLFKTQYLQRETNLILDVKNPSALFDIRTDVLKKYISPGGRVRANVTIVNMGDLNELFDVSFDYKLMDFSNNNYSSKNEQFAMNESYFNVFSLDIPKDLKPGNYIFYTKVNYGDVFASSYDTFVVENISFWFWLVAILMLLSLVIFIIWKLKKKRKGEKPKIKIKPRRMFIRRKVSIPRLPQEI